ncbi:nickel pincer cofactor biosynthesis protein LarB [Botrimarina sp.]|uniref:nickel pincer cofactor biosynthesis protein LarB n=1 Tax=Botrimarina sp. TaxID=2795802 RepID=UPI0032EBB4C7
MQEPLSQPLADGAVTLDADRRRRCGYPEVVYGEGKSAETIAEILAAQLARGEQGLATRVAADAAERIALRLPSARYNALARTVRVAPEGSHPVERRGLVAVVTAGTTDLPVAEEAAETLDWMGAAVTRVNDVGVAGPHRLRERLADFESADAVVVVAGMEGALPSVLGGYVACPVIAVPTSVGYGANLGGMAALLSMLNSCASNVAVVNIDAGFKGGYLAGIIAARAAAR